MNDSNNLKTDMDLKVEIVRLRKMPCLCIRKNGSLYPMIYLRKPRHLREDTFDEMLGMLLVDMKKLEDLFRNTIDQYYK